MLKFLDAMALCEHLAAGALGRELRDKGSMWVGKHLEEVAAKPSLLELLGVEVAALVAPDNVDSQEEEIFAAVLGWVKKDKERRATELDRLLPLVRFPLMREHATAMMTEPLVQPTCWRRS
jgi:hypothetical protein